MDKTKKQLEETILHEGIVNVLGLTSENVQIGIKGDPSIRQTVYSRPKYKSTADRNLTILEENLCELLINRSTYRIFVGLNSGEIRTSSIFDPMREEIHSCENIIDKNYLDRHYPICLYKDKIKNISLLYSFIRNSREAASLPEHWQSIIQKRKKNWKPMSIEQIKKIMTTMGKLRTAESFYLRNISVNIMQSLIRMQFNCDGTQVVKADNFQKFLEQNF
jgi:hypothetical protein